jgi:DinB superfamily
MQTVATRRPGADEHAPGFAGYIARIGQDEDVMAVLADQLDEVLGRLGAISEERGNYRYAPGKWSIKEIVCHLSDTERIFAYRALRIARGDTTPLPGFDENAYAPEMRADDRTLADLSAEWGDVRRATLSLFRHLPAPVWERRGTASGHPSSVRALAYATAGHVRHHLDVLGARYLV